MITLAKNKKRGSGVRGHIDYYQISAIPPFAHRKADRLLPSVNGNIEVFTSVTRPFNLLATTHPGNDAVEKDMSLSTYVLEAGILELSGCDH